MFKFVQRLLETKAFTGVEAFNRKAETLKSEKPTKDNIAIAIAKEKGVVSDGHY